jgi:hypothetical protein
MQGCDRLCLRSRPTVKLVREASPRHRDLPEASIATAWPTEMVRDMRGMRGKYRLHGLAAIETRGIHRESMADGNGA